MTRAFIVKLEVEPETNLDQLNAELTEVLTFEFEEFISVEPWTAPSEPSPSQLVNSINPL